MKKILKGWLRWGFLLLALVWGLAILRIPEARAEAKDSLAILPFLVERGEDPGRGAMCPLCKGVYRKGEILPGSQNTLTRLLYQKVETMGTFKVVPLEKMEGVFSNWDMKVFEEKPIPSSVQLGKELNVDFVMTGFLFRFEERIGSSLGVEKPASVGFDVHLIRLKGEKMVWTGKFDETQRPLSENLFKIGSFVRRKASWLTAEELSSVGMDEMLKRFLGSKELEEIP
jgi:TolB-like protein